MDGRVPGSIYTDLLAAGVLDQGPLLFRFNDVDYRWVSYNDWTYRLQFDGNSKKKNHRNPQKLRRTRSEPHQPVYNSIKHGKRAFQCKEIRETEFNQRTQTKNLQKLSLTRSKPSKPM